MDNHVVALAGVRVRQQDERGGLLDQGSGDITLQRVFRALRGEDAQAVLLTDGLLLVLRELLQATLLPSSSASGVVVVNFVTISSHFLGEMKSETI